MRIGTHFCGLFERNGEHRLRREHVYVRDHLKASSAGSTGSSQNSGSAGTSGPTGAASTTAGTGAEGGGGPLAGKAYWSVDFGDADPATTHGSHRLGGVGLDASGNVLMAGQFTGTLKLSDTLTLSAGASGKKAVFVAKLDQTGQAQLNNERRPDNWQRKIG